MCKQVPEVCEFLGIIQRMFSQHRLDMDVG